MAMKIIDIINVINNGEKVPVVAKSLGVSKDTLSRRLKSVGYKFDNSLKKYIYFGNDSEKNRNDETLFSDLVLVKTVSKKKLRNNSDEEKESVSEKGMNKLGVENIFSSEEILELKKIIKVFQDDKSKIFLDLLPVGNTGKVVKKTVLVGDDLYGEFEKFADNFSNKHVTKHQLIELALYELMKKYS
ncbi:TPA: hypothetical protein ACSC8Z_005811 [Bacillus paranthracis]